LTRRQQRKLDKKLKKRQAKLNEELTHQAGEAKMAAIVLINKRRAEITTDQLSAHLMKGPLMRKPPVPPAPPKPDGTPKPPPQIVKPPLPKQQSAEAIEVAAAAEKMEVARQEEMKKFKKEQKRKWNAKGHRWLHANDFEYTGTCKGGSRLNEFYRPIYGVDSGWTEHETEHEILVEGVSATRLYYHNDITKKTQWKMPKDPEHDENKKKREEEKTNAKEEEKRKKKKTQDSDSDSGDDQEGRDVGGAVGKALALAKFDARGVHDSADDILLRSTVESSPGALYPFFAALEDEEGPGLLELKLTNLRLGDTEALELEAGLATTQHLTSLDLRSNSIGVAGCEAMMRGIEESESLTALHLSFNPIGDEGVACIGRALATVESVTDLSLSNVGVGVVGIEDFVAEGVLDSFCVLTSLDLSHNRLGDEGCLMIASMLREVAAGTPGDGEGADTVAAAASVKQPEHALRCLNLSDNQIGCSGVQGLMACLNMASAPGEGGQLGSVGITDLQLDENFIRNEGAMALSAELQRAQSKIERLSLVNNCIGSIGCEALSAALSRNHSLASLDLSSNRLTDDNIAKLAAALKKNTTLQTIAIGHNAVSNEGVEVLAAALEKNQTLTRINMRHNAITARGMARFAKLMARPNTSLEWVDLQSWL
jgi:Ran GTPase-activating protein (RanGAP) involved in mRNA processing and transport